jgi:hypothetical protein
VNYVIEGLEGATLHGLAPDVVIAPGKITPVTALVKVPKSVLKSDVTPLTFIAEVSEKQRLSIKYKTVFMGPK